MLPLEPDFSYLEALAPYQPLAMKCIYCPIDTRLNFIQVSKLLKEVQVMGKLCWRLPRSWHLCADCVCGVRARMASCTACLPHPFSVCGVLSPVPSRLQTGGLYTLKEVSPLKKSKVGGKESVNSVSFLMRTICVQLKVNYPLPPPKKIILETYSSN